MFTKVWRGTVGATNNMAFCAIFDSILKVFFSFVCREYCHFTMIYVLGE